jgi:oxygen-independent coproporphyrinogen-3 oxidase
VDREAAAVGRLHKRETVLADISRLRAAGISNINLDLIAGLPHQTVDSWRFSLDEVIATGVPHVSVYMLEIDEDSRLGRELIAGGTKYHAHFVPDENLTADLYGIACERLHAAKVEQYEISNFARAGFESRHNLKYWTRQPYLGFGVDAHSMLRSRVPDYEAVRFSTPDSPEDFTAAKPGTRTVVSSRAALEECFFLGLRLSKGVSLEQLRGQFGTFVVTQLNPILVDLASLELIDWSGDEVRLTDRGRLLSNEAFERFLQTQESPQPS